MTSLFDNDSLPSSHERLEEGAVLLRGFAAAEAPVLLEEVGRIAERAAFRHFKWRNAARSAIRPTSSSSTGASAAAKPRSSTAPSSSRSWELGNESLSKREVITRFPSSSGLRKLMSL